MSDTFHFAAFLARWHDDARHDLSVSHSNVLTLEALLSLADADEQALLDKLSLTYASPNGSVSLRELVAGQYNDLTTEDIVCCAGAQEAMACVARALLGRGDHAVIVLPIYQPLEWTITERATATGVSLNPNTLALDLDRVAASIKPNTKLVLTNFPNSPTGAIVDAATQSALVDLCRKNGVWLVNDEVYRHSTWDQARQPAQIADIYERGVSINSLSKGFGLPGLRVGWVACPDRELLARVSVAKAVLSSCIAAPSEILARIALRQGALLTERARKIGLLNRQRLDALLHRHAHLFEPDPPRTLAFGCPKYRGLDGAESFAAKLVATAGALILPTSLWRSPLGMVPTDRLRISLGGINVIAGLEAIETYLDVAAAL